MSESFDPNEPESKPKKRYWNCIECRSFHHCKIIKERRLACPNHADAVFQNEKNYKEIQ